MVAKKRLRPVFKRLTMQNSLINFKMRIMLFLAIPLCFILWNCAFHREVNYYEGHIFDQNKQAISNIMVYERDRPENKVFTDSSGYFQLKKPKNLISNFLMVKKDAIILDSIQVLRTRAGEQVNYVFVEGRQDTLFLKIE